MVMADPHGWMSFATLSLSYEPLISVRLSIAKVQQQRRRYARGRDWSHIIMIFF